MENWKIGDVAICINVGDLNESNAINPPLRLNAEYVVQNINTCPRCKSMQLDVGLSNNSSNRGTLCGCGERVACAEIHWANSKRFKKKKAKKSKAELEEELEKALEDENYELAEELKKELS